MSRFAADLGLMANKNLGGRGSDEDKKEMFELINELRDWWVRNSFLVPPDLLARLNSLSSVSEILAGPT
ncbi:MAG: hypothetical protein ACE5JC_07165, partial [Candidatus Zixiibacteriota bacterium]